MKHSLRGFILVLFFSSYLLSVNGQKTLCFKESNYQEVDNCLAKLMKAYSELLSNTSKDAKKSKKGNQKDWYQTEVDENGHVQHYKFDDNLKEWKKVDTRPKESFKKNDMLNDKNSKRAKEIEDCDNSIQQLMAIRSTLENLGCNFDLQISGLLIPISYTFNMRLYDRTNIVDATNDFYKLADEIEKIKNDYQKELAKNRALMRNEFFSAVYEIVHKDLSQEEKNKAIEYLTKSEERETINAGNSGNKISSFPEIKSIQNVNETIVLKIDTDNNGIPDMQAIKKPGEPAVYQSIEEKEIIDPQKYEIVILRNKSVDGLVTGEMYLNGVYLGPTYENEVKKIPSGTFEGNMRYQSERNFVQGKDGLMSNTGDFLLEINDVPGRESILLHGGIKKESSEGCIMLGPVTKKGSKGQVDNIHTLSKLRSAFYGASNPNSSPNKHIIFTIKNP